MKLFHNNTSQYTFRDAIVIPIINSATSFYGGFVIFSVAGYMAHLTGKTVHEVGASGTNITQTNWNSIRCRANVMFCVPLTSFQ